MRYVKWINIKKKYMDANKKRCKHRILRKMIEFQKEIGTLGKEIDRKNTLLLHFCCRGKVRKMIGKKS